MLNWHARDGVFLALAVGFIGTEFNADVLAFVFAFQCFFKA